jgi:NAD(P)-dependent dehydrogenase (short-subunit alcohol dehydrogenase family)
MEQKILITGAAGTIGSMLRHSLAQPDRHLRLLDVAAQSELSADESAELIVGSFLNLDTMSEACRDVSVVIHLGGLSSGGYSWDEYLSVNINGTFVVLEAARRAGVPRVIYASSHHAVGFQPSNTGVTVPDYYYPRPDSFYGVSKVASESLCSLYHDRHGIDAICLRIGSYRTRPTDARSLWNWLSPGDCTRLFEAALTTPRPGFRVVWGVSANSRGIMSLDEANAIGYFPLDDAEKYASDVAASGEADGPGVRDFIGGPYAAPTFE